MILLAGCMTKAPGLQHFKGHVADDVENGTGVQNEGQNPEEASVTQVRCTMAAPTPVQPLLLGILNVKNTRGASLTQRIRPISV